MRRSKLWQEIGGVANFTQEYRQQKAKEALQRNMKTPRERTAEYRRVYGWGAFDNDNTN